MIKKCPVCKKEFDGSPKKKYCSPKCKKFVENSKRGAPEKKAKKPDTGKTRPPSDNTNHPQDIPSNITKPDNLNPIASAYWDKVSPLLIKRGHLNVLSEAILAEYCDVYSRLQDINRTINEANRSLLQIENRWVTNLDEEKGIETQSLEESAPSKNKRNYSALLLKYAKDLYLTPLSNRGNFGLEDEEKKDPEEEFLK